MGSCLFIEGGITHKNWADRCRHGQGGFPSEGFGSVYDYYAAFIIGFFLEMMLLMYFLLDEKIVLDRMGTFWSSNYLFLLYFFYTSPLASGDEDASTEKSTEVSAESGRCMDMFDCIGDCLTYDVRIEKRMPMF